MLFIIAIFGFVFAALLLAAATLTGNLAVLGFGFGALACAAFALGWSNKAGRP